MLLSIRPGGDNILGKAPTTLVFNKFLGAFSAFAPDTWGQLGQKHIMGKGQSLVEDFKLFLIPDSQSNGDFYQEPIIKYDYFGSNNGLDIVELISTYLTYLKRHVLRCIKNMESEQQQTLSVKQEKKRIKYVLTIPSMWNSSAKQVMIEAAAIARISRDDVTSDMAIITEPCAAALYCKEHFFGKLDKRDGMKFIVCDAGAAIVDALTFILNIDGSTGEEILSQIGFGNADTCGSAYFDKNFRQYLLKFYEDIGFPVDKSKLKLDHAVNRFIEDIKVGNFYFIQLLYRIER